MAWTYAKVVFCVYGMVALLWLSPLAETVHRKSPLGGDLPLIDFHTLGIFSESARLNYNFQDLADTSHPRMNYCLSDFLYGNNTDLDAAVRAMEYHRRMMNNYMLSEYLTKNIVASLPLPKSDNKLLKKRISTSNNDTLSHIKKGSDDHHKPLNDEGSSRYFSWLRRLDQLNNHWSKLLYKKRNPISQRRLSSVATYDNLDLDNDLKYLEDGHITGYAYTADENTWADLKSRVKKRIAENRNGMRETGGGLKASTGCPPWSSRWTEFSF